MMSLLLVVSLKSNLILGWNSMYVAVWNDMVLAQSEHCIEVEGNQYFPRSDVKSEFVKEYDLKSVCPWKGTASYFDVVVGGIINEGAAWYYPEPSEKAKHIKGFVAFWKGVEVSWKN